jgi:hypothetical protein
VSKTMEVSRPSMLHSVDIRLTAASHRIDDPISDQPSRGNTIDLSLSRQ